LKGTNNKIWVGWLAFLFIVVHFTFIVIYAFPATISNPKLKAFARPYVEPIFTQTWGMFAPCPTVNSTIEIKFYFEDDSTGWVNPVADAANKHSYLRGSHHGEIVLAASNLYYWLSLDLAALDVSIGDDFPTDRMAEFYDGFSYYKIRNFIRGNGWYLYDSEVESAIIRCYLEDVVSGEEGVIELPKINLN
jgi:hypothetical protein